MLSSKTLRLASVAAVAGLLAMPAFVGEANAAAKAFSSLHVEDFIISDEDGQLDFETDFDIILGGNSSSSQGSLDGTTVGDSDGPSLGDVDADLSCVGSGCVGIGDNDFNQQAFPPTNSFGRGDSRVLGSGILNAPGASQDSVTADTVAEAQIVGNSSGTGNGTTGTDTVFNFSLTEDRQLTFSFSAQGIMELILDPDSQAGSITGADFEFSITIREADTNEVVFEWTPDGVVNDNIVGGTENDDDGDLSQEASRLTPGTTSIDTGLGLFSATTDMLSALIDYTLTVSHTSNARATLVVPEPRTLALFSLGLLAIGGLIVTQRRRGNNRTA